MRGFGLLDRHLFVEWSKIFSATAVGFPVFVIIIEVVEKLDQYQAIPPLDLALSYVYSFPEKLLLVLPAAVLFATAFTMGSFSKHMELSAAQACGRSFHRLLQPRADDRVPRQQAST